MDIGFIGLGHMGSGMARCLLKAGHRLKVYNRSRDKAEKLAAEGAVVVDRPGDACRGDAVITMLADDGAVEGVTFGEGNILASLGQNTVHVSMSTISVALSDRLSQAHGKAGRAYIAAPVFGRPDAAAAGKLFIVAAGPAKTVARCQPLFNAMGQKTFELGEKPSAANLVKLSGNFLITVVIESLGETVALTRKAGIDPHKFLDILTSSLFAAPIYKTYGGIIADQKFEPAGFKMTLGFKDNRLALAAAEALAVPLPLASQIHDHFLTAIAQGHGDRDWSALAQLAAENAGLGDGRATPRA
jgi:3-hydroxyisobutyrate dehydrogenase-like beta-hydroxyacid dehydrogenase